MDKKHLADKIKNIRSEKLKEQKGKSQPFSPAHHTATHGEDPESPNQYAHKMVKEYLSTAIAKGDLGNLKNRQNKINAQSRPLGGKGAMNARHFGEGDGEKPLGKTDTNQSGETIDTTPEKKELKGQLK